MTFTKEKTDFFRMLSAEGIDHTLGERLLVLANRYQTLQELQCSYEGAEVFEEEEKQLEGEIRKCLGGALLGVRLGGDPRGFTVKLLLKSGRNNTWGGPEYGYGVPTPQHTQESLKGTLAVGPRTVNQTLRTLSVQVQTVIFRTGKHDGEVTALLLGQPANPGNVVSYAHVGQHGEASWIWVRGETRPATAAEYAPLFAELRRIYEISHAPGDEPVKLRLALNLPRRST